MEKQNLSSRAPRRQEADLRVTQAITVNPQISEREFAEQLGLSWDRALSSLNGYSRERELD